MPGADPDDFLRAAVPLAVLAAMCGSMRQQARAARQALPAAVSPSDFPAVPSILRALACDCNDA